MARRWPSMPSVFAMTFRPTSGLNPRGQSRGRHWRLLHSPGERVRLSRLFRVGAVYDSKVLRRLRRGMRWVGTRDASVARIRQAAAPRSRD